MAEPWNIDTRTEAIDSVNAAHDSLIDVVDCAEEMDDREACNLIEAMRANLTEFAAWLETKR